MICSIVFRKRPWEVEKPFEDEENIVEENEQSTPIVAQKVENEQSEEEDTDTGT
jgi:hypothetical protein